MRGSTTPSTAGPLAPIPLPAPDFRRGFLRVPLGFWLGAFCRSPLSRREIQVLSAVLRESWGWTGRDGSPRLWTRPLPTRRIASLTGLSTDRLRRDVDGLVRRGVLQRKEDRYRIVPDPGFWQGRAYPQAAMKGTPERRSLPPKPPGNAAETAPPSGADRKRKEREKKRLAAGAELSTGPDGAAPGRDADDPGAFLKGDTGGGGTGEGNGAVSGGR